MEHLFSFVNYICIIINKVINTTAPIIFQILEMFSICTKLILNAFLKRLITKARSTGFFRTECSELTFKSLRGDRTYLKKHFFTRVQQWLRTRGRFPFPFTHAFLYNAATTAMIQRMNVPFQSMANL